MKYSKLMSVRMAFYPTYEEWKHHNWGKAGNRIYAFYPTYEEWKHVKNLQKQLEKKLFLSYL